MSAEKSVGNALDWLKWSVVVALLIGGVVGNWYFQEVSLLVRVIALLVAAVLAGFVAVQTERGQGIWSLIKEARTEVRPSGMAVEPGNYPNDLGRFGHCAGVLVDLVGAGFTVELDRQLHYRIA